MGRRNVSKLLYKLFRQNHTFLRIFKPHVHPFPPYCFLQFVFLSNLANTSYENYGLWV